MKHLKLFESKENEGELIEKIIDCYRGLFLNTLQLERRERERWQGPDASFYNNLLNRGHIELDIRRNYTYGKSIMIRMRENIGFGDRDKFTNGFEGLDIKLQPKFKKSHEDTLKALGNPPTLVGISSHHSDRIFDIFYFLESPRIPKGVEVFGGTVLQKLNQLNLVLEADLVNHDNCFNIYDDNWQIKGLYALWGYYDMKYLYDRPLTIISGGNNGEPKGPIDMWLTREWETVCDKIKINPRWGRYPSKVNHANPKIDVPGFFRYLAANQDSYISIKAPKLYFGS